MIQTRLWPIITKEFIQMRRDRLTLAMMIMIPVIQLLLFGFAVNTDVKHLPTVVFDQCRQQESREILAAFQNSQYYDLVYYVNSFDEVTRAIDSGQAKVAIVFPPDFAEALTVRRQATMQVIVDASDPMTASSAISTASAIGQLRSIQVMTQVLQKAGISAPLEMPVDVRVRAWYNPDLVSANFIVPGLLGVILTMTMVMVTAMAIVRERERGTLEQLIVTPIKKYELMIGKIVPYIVVGYVQLTLALLSGIWIFSVPVVGNLTLLYVLTLIFMVANLGMGLLISTVAKNQQQAMQMSIFVILPTILLSGFVFPRESMPALIYGLGYLIPATYYLQILRGIILKGVSLPYLWQYIWPLTIYSVAIIALGIVRFRKKLE
ncbi:MAG: ABC transporter permease [Firmicutes bacterium]|nr:ABC transporter permease [Bacillota bacterium]